MYQTQPVISAQVQIGDVWIELVEVNSTGITHPEPPSTTPTSGISKSVPAKPANPGKLAPGTFTYELNPADSSKVLRELNKAARESLNRDFREDEGNYRKVRANTSGAMVAIAPDASGAATGDLTLSGAGANIGSNESPASPWDRHLILVVGAVAYDVEDILTSTTAQVSRIGLVGAASDGVRIVVPDEAAITNVAATATWELHEYAIRRTFTALVTQAPGYTIAANARSKTVSGQLRAFENETFLIAE